VAWLQEHDGRPPVRMSAHAHVERHLRVLGRANCIHGLWPRASLLVAQPSRETSRIAFAQNLLSSLQQELPECGNGVVRTAGQSQHTCASKGRRYAAAVRATPPCPKMNSRCPQALRARIMRSGNAESQLAVCGNVAKGMLATVKCHSHPKQQSRQLASECFQKGPT
jgi:hypothetical protein